MLTLVIGGAGSGKSRYAEALVASQPGPRVYLATMRPTDGESDRRVLRHRAQREGMGFLTVERYTDLTGAPVPPGSSVLLEDLGNLLANEMFDGEGGGAAAVRTGLEVLIGRCADLCVVSNEVFSGGSDYAGETLDYLRELAALNRELAAKADRVVELVCGLPNVLKGGAE